MNFDLNISNQTLQHLKKILGSTIGLATPGYPATSLELAAARLGLTVGLLYSRHRSACRWPRAPPAGLATSPTKSSC